MFIILPVNAYLPLLMMMGCWWSMWEYWRHLKIDHRLDWSSEYSCRETICFHFNFRHSSDEEYFRADWLNWRLVLRKCTWEYRGYWWWYAALCKKSLNCFGFFGESNLHFSQWSIIPLTTVILYSTTFSKLLATVCRQRRDLHLNGLAVIRFVCSNMCEYSCNLLSLVSSSTANYGCTVASMRHTREVVAIYAGTLHNGWTEWEGESEIVGGTKKNSNRMECCFALDCDERHRLQLQLLFSDRIQIHRHQQSLLCTGCTFG